MPSNPEAHLISAALRSGDLKNAIAHGISGDMFHTFRDEWLWMEQYFRRYRKAPSIETFTAAFGDFRVLRSTDTLYFTDEVRKSHARHMLIALMDAVADDVAGGDLDSAIKKASSSIIEIAGSMGAMLDTDIFSDYRDIFADVAARKQRTDEKGRPGIPTGFDTLDMLTGGWAPGEHNVIAARLGHGKSWIMQHSAATAAAAGYTVCFNALEQTKTQVAMRIHTLLSANAQQLFRATSLIQGRDFNLREYRRFLVRLKKEMPGKLHVSDASRGRVSPLTIAAQIERHQPDIVFVDYLGLMQKSGPDWQGVAQLSADMQVLAANYGIPIVSANQLNRDAVGKNWAATENLSGSDAVGQDASIILMLKEHTESVREAALAKNRNGRGGARWWLQFTPNDGVIKEITYTKAQDLMDRDAEKADEEQDKVAKRK